MDTNEKLLADYSAELGLSYTISLQELINSHNRQRDIISQDNESFRDQITYWKQVYKIDYESSITRDICKNMSVQEFTEWLNG